MIPSDHWPVVVATIPFVLRITELYFWISPAQERTGTATTIIIHESCCRMSHLYVRLAVPTAHSRTLGSPNGSPDDKNARGAPSTAKMPLMISLAQHGHPHMRTASVRAPTVNPCRESRPTGVRSRLCYFGTPWHVRVVVGV